MVESPSWGVVGPRDIIQDGVVQKNTRETVIGRDVTGIAQIRRSKRDVITHATKKASVGIPGSGREGETGRPLSHR